VTPPMLVAPPAPPAAPAAPVAPPEALEPDPDTTVAAPGTGGFQATP
jgi:hypothetical protein